MRIVDTRLPYIATLKHSNMRYCTILFELTYSILQLSQPAYFMERNMEYFISRELLNAQTLDKY